MAEEVLAAIAKHHEANGLAVLPVEATEGMKKVIRDKFAPHFFKYPASDGAGGWVDGATENYLEMARAYLKEKSDE